MRDTELLHCSWPVGLEFLRVSHVPNVSHQPETDGKGFCLFALFSQVLLKAFAGLWRKSYQEDGRSVLLAV